MFDAWKTRKVKWTKIHRYATALPGAPEHSVYTYHWFREKGIAFTFNEDEIMFYRNTVFFVHCCLGIAGLYASAVMAQADKVDVCHIPPGNPENAHTITISENAVEAHLEHGDYLGACDPEVIIEIDDPGRPTPSACTCPRAGVWRVTNLEGWMECNVLGIKRKNSDEDINDGAIWILNDDCSTIFSEAYEKQREDVIMDRGRDCLFFGVAPGERDGAKAIFDGAYKVETEEFITGEYFMEMSGAGISCTGYSPFKIDFLKPLSEKDYAKLEKKMQKELEKARETLDEHREKIDQYLEETNGGKAFGGRNGQD